MSNTAAASQKASVSDQTKREAYRLIVTAALPIIKGKNAHASAETEQSVASNTNTSVMTVTFFDADMLDSDMVQQLQSALGRFAVYASSHTTATRQKCVNVRIDLSAYEEWNATSRSMISWRLIVLVLLLAVAAVFVPYPWAQRIFEELSRLFPKGIESAASG